MPSYPRAPFSRVAAVLREVWGTFLVDFFFFFNLWDVAALREAQNLLSPQILQWLSECIPQQADMYMYIHMYMADSSREVSGIVNKFMAGSITSSEIASRHSWPRCEGKLQPSG